MIVSKAVAFGEILYGTNFPNQSGKETFSDYTQRVVDNAQVLAQALLDAGWDLVS